MTTVAAIDHILCGFSVFKDDERVALVSQGASIEVEAD